MRISLLVINIGLDCIEQQHRDIFQNQTAGHGSQQAFFNLTDALTNRNGKWNNVIFQNFIWGQEDQMKVELDCIEHIKVMKRNKPVYNGDNWQDLSVSKVFDLNGISTNYIDDRYSSRSRRDLSYGNPCGPEKTACGSVYTYTGRPTMSSEPCWKLLNYVCYKTIDSSFIQYQNIWNSGAIGNLYMSSGSSAAQLTFPQPVKLSVWNGVIANMSDDGQTYTVAQRVHGNFYEKHSGKGILMFNVEWGEDNQVIKPNEIIITV